MKKTILTALVVALAVMACDKDEEVKLSNLEILQAHNWKFSAMVRTENGIASDLFTPDNCEIDDTYEFQSNLTVIYYTGTTECYPNQEASFAEKYWLSENQDTLHFEDEFFPTLIKSISLEKIEWETKLEEPAVGFLSCTLVEDK